MKNKTLRHIALLRNAAFIGALSVASLPDATRAQTNTVDSLRITSSRTDASGTLNINPDSEPLPVAVRLGFASNVTWLVTNAGTVVNVNGLFANSVINTTNPITNNGLIIASGAVVNVSSYFYNGYYTEARNTFVTVVGAGSQLNVSSEAFYFNAYNSPFATLTLSNGGVLTTGGARAGGAEDDEGNRVYIVGTNSLWRYNSSETLEFGYDTGSVLTLSDGGALEAPIGTVAFAGADPSGPSRLRGNGTVTAGKGIEFVNAGRLTPEGAAPLILNGNLSFGDNSFFDWNLFTNSTSGPGTNFSVPVQLNGDIAVVNQAVLAINLGAGVTNDSFWDTTRSWDLITTTTGNLKSGTRFDLSFTGNTNGITLDNFSLLSTNNALRLVYTVSTDFYWNTNEVGLWSTGANWSANAVPGAGNNAFIDHGGTATVNAAAPVNSVVIGSTNGSAGGNLTLSNGALTVSGGVSVASASGSTGTLNFNGGSLVTPAIAFGSGTGSVNFNQTGALSVTNAISGAGELRQLGAGTTTISRSNSFSGGTTISNGMLYITVADALGTGSLNLTGTGTLGFGGSFTFANAITTGVASGGLFVDKLTTVALTGGISGTGGIDKSGSGVLVYSNANTYTGTTTISDGTLSLAGTAGSLGAGTVTNNGILSIDRDNAMTLSNAMSGSGFLVKNGATTLTVTGDLTHTGGTEINAGTIRVGDGGTTGSLGDGGSIINKGSLVFERSDAGLVVSGNISGSGTVTQAGSGTTTLSGSNIYTGVTTISNGVLRSGNNGSLSSGSGFELKGGTISVNGTTNSIVYLDIVSGDHRQTDGRLVSTTPGFERALRIAREAGQSASYTLDGGFLGTTNGGQFQLGNRGTGVFNQNGGTNSISGWFVIGRWSPGGNGTYNLNGGLSEQSAANRRSIIGEDGTGVMNVNGGVYSNAGRILIASTTNAVGTLNIRSNGVVLAPEVQFGAGNGLLNFDRDDSYTFVAPITGSGRVTKNGTGTVTLTNNNSYTRGTTISNGTLIVQGALANNASNTVTVESPGTLVFATNNVFGSVDATISTPIIINGGAVLNTSNTTNALGAVTMNGGALQSTAGSTFALKGTVTVNSNATASGPGNFALGSGAVSSTTFEVTNGSTLTFEGALVDGTKTGQTATQASSLVKSGGGTMTLVGANTYSGTTTIDGGTLQVGTNGTSGMLGAGDVINNSLLVLNRSDDLDVGNNISGSGGLVQAGSGKTTLTGDNTYTNTTTISSGALLLDGTHTGGGTYTVGTNALFGGSGEATAGVVVQDGGTIRPGDGVSAGKLIVGDFTLESGGLLNILLGGSKSSLIFANGDVNLAGNLSFTELAALDKTLYPILEFTGALTGNFSSITALPTGYVLQTNNDTIFLRQADIPVTIGVSFNGNNEVITGGTLNFNVLVDNEYSNSVSFWATNTGGWTNVGGDIPTNDITANTTAELPGLSWTGTNVGTNNGTFVANYTASGITNSTNVGLTVIVYGHAAGSLLTNSVTMPGAIAGYTNVSPFISATVAVTNSNGFRVNLATASTWTNSNISVQEVEGVEAGSSASLVVNYSGQEVGRKTNNVEVAFRDDSTLAGAATNGTSTLQVVTTIYEGAAGSVTGGPNIVFAPVHSGYTSAQAPTNTLTISNQSGEFRVDLGVADNNTDPWITIDPAAGLVQGTTTNLGITLAVGRDPGKFTNNVTLTYYDDSDLLGASTNRGTTDIVISGYVYSGQGVWTNSGSGEWASFDSWDVPGGKPGLDGALSVDDTANFGDLGSGTVFLNTNASLLAVTFSNTSASYTVQGAGTLTLAESLGTAPSLTTAAGTHSISNAVAVVGDLQLETTGNLLLAGSVSGTGSLQHTGAGTTTLSGSNYFAGGLGISNGQVVLSNAAPAGTGAISLLAREEERVAVPQIVLGVSGMTVSNAINLPTDALDPTDPNRHLLMAAIEMTGGTNQLTGAITGDGSLEVTGTGTMVITGTGNTYQGATRVSGGATLEVNAIDGTLGTGDDFYAYIDIVDATFRYTGGTTNTGRELYMNEGSLSTIEVTDPSANLTIDPTTPGELSVDFVKAGAGTLTFGVGAVYEGDANITVAAGTFVTEAENSFTGNTTISNAATFKLGGAGQLGGGDYAGNINNAGSLILDTTADQKLSGVISGAGSLTQSGAGTLTVTGANTYAGGTTIGTGSALVMAGDGNLGTGDVMNAGSLIVETVANQALANAISGAGSVTKSGEGRLTVSGANTYTGGTTINTGTLVTTSPTALGTGAVQLLGGTLELQSPLNVASFLWDGGGGTTQIAIPNPGANFLTVSTPITILNGVNNFNLAGANPTGPVKLLDAPGLTENDISLFGFEGLDPESYRLEYGEDGALYLVLTAPPPPPPTPKPEKPKYPDFTQFAGNPNQMQVAQALNKWVTSNPPGDRAKVLDALVASGDYQKGFEAMMPSQYASLPNMAFNQANALNSGMFQRLWVIRINGKGFSSSLSPAPMQAEMGGVDDMEAFAISPSKETKWGTFVDGNGIFAEGGDVANLQNYRSQSGGVSAGASYKWTDTFATGVYVGYQGLQAQYDNGQTTDNAVRFGVFGTYEIGGLYFNALAGGAYHDYSVEREIEFGSIDRTARGRPGAGEFDLAIGTGYDFKAGDFTFGPFTTMQYTYLGVQGFKETGADSLNLDVDPYNSSSLLYTLGAQVGYNWKVSPSVLVTPTLFAGWQHEFLQDGYQINSSFNTGGPASPFSYNTGTPARDNFYGGVGVTVGLGETWQATAIYSAFVGGDNQSSQNVYLGLGLNF
jgi:autotransporter-associated beta strand protein